MKCNNCNKFATNFIKTMVMTASWTQRATDTFSLDTYLGYMRRELIEVVKKDVEEGKNEGEIFYCDDCFKQRNKKPWIGRFEK